MKRSSKVVVLIVFTLALILCGIGTFCFGQNNEKKQIQTMEVVIVGKNEYKSELIGELRNTTLTVDDFDFQWWYLDNNDGYKKNIPNATQYKYVIEEEFIGKHIGVSVKYKNSSSDSTVYEDVTDVEENDSVTVKLIETKLDLKKSSGIYNGNIIKSNGVLVNNSAPVVYTFYTDQSCTIKTTTDTGASFEGGAPIDAGNYYVRASVDEVNGYKGTLSKCVSHTIKPAEVTVSWLKTKYIYNGEKQGPQASIINNVTNEQINISNSLASNAGEYISEASCQSVEGGRGKCSNYKLIGDTKKYKIDVAVPSIELNPKTDVYSGVPIDANKVNVDSVGEVTYTYYVDNKCTKKTNYFHGVAKEGDAPVDAGRYYVQASVGDTGNTSNAVSACVEHIIEPKLVDVVWKQNTFTYNGDSKTPVLETSTGTDEVIILSAKSKVFPGEYDSDVECYKVSGGRKKCSNYELNNRIGKLVILKATPSVSLSSKMETYNGKEIIANKASTVSGLAVSYKYYTDSSCNNLTTSSVGAIALGSAPVDAGNYYVRAYVEGNDIYNNAESGCVSHTINPILVDIKYTEKEFTYDGTNKSLLFNTNYSKISSENIQLTSPSFVDAGLYFNEVICNAVHGGRGKCSNYEIKNSKEYLKINRANGSIIVSQKEKIFDNDFQEPSYSRLGDGSVDFKYYSNDNCTNEIIGKPINAGNYYTKATVSQSRNYEKSSSKCVSYVINKYPAVVSWNTLTYTYNGHEQGPTAIAQLLGVSTNMNTTKAIDAGSYKSIASCVDGDSNVTSCSNYSFNSDYLIKDYEIQKSPVLFGGETSTIELVYPEKHFTNYQIFAKDTEDIVSGNINCVSDDLSVVTCSNTGNNNIKITSVGNGKTKIKLNYEETLNYKGFTQEIEVKVNNPVMNLELVDPMDSSNNQTRIIEYGQSINLPALYADGVQFMGWAENDDGLAIYDYNSLYYNNSEVNNYAKTLYAVWSTDFIEKFDDATFNYILNFSGSYSFANDNLIIPPKSKFNFEFSNFGNTKMILSISGAGEFTINNQMDDFSYLASPNFEDYTFSTFDGVNTITIVNSSDNPLNIKFISVSPIISTSPRIEEESTWVDLVMSIKALIQETWYLMVEKLRKLFN